MDDHQKKMHKKREELQELIKSNYKYSTPTPSNNNNNATGNGNDDARNSIFKDSIDLREKIPTPFNDVRKKLILEFFIQHFISMARKSNEFRNYGQVRGDS